MIKTTYSDAILSGFEYLLENYPESYNTDYHIEWGFCRYFWESHILFPDIHYDNIEKSVIKQIQL